ncbi:MAG: lipopolysaccharide transport periplasmic protein LptA [Gammaproteobacteria bacterium]|nr:lipopolysaccharide transport periplasmic protein LptA [Gammaproteobacteria bacterium]
MKNPMLLMLVLAAGHVPAAGALESDRDQPAVIDADAVDIDFQQGLRVYTGNVKLRQGTIRLDADRVEVRFKDDQLETAVAEGNPAVFRQRPDGKDVDVVGEGRYIHMDEINNVITLTNNAVLTQGADSVSGRVIIYNMATDKMQVRSGDTPTRTTKTPEGAAAPAPEPSSEPAQAPASTGAAAAEETTADGEPRRPRIVLQPKEAETEAAPPDAAQPASGTGTGTATE